VDGMTGTAHMTISHPPPQHEHKCAYSSAVTWPPGEIRRRRNAKGWSQDDLAEALGVSRRAVTNWETGVARPSGANLDALDQALGDAPLPEPTLRGATDLEFAAELLRRLGVNTGPDAGPVELPAEDLAWPRRKPRRNAHRKA